MEASERLVTGHVDIDPMWRGGQRQAFLLATGLAAHGHPTHFFTAPETPLAGQLADTPVRVHAVPTWGEWDPFAARRLAREANEAGVQVLAAHSAHAHGLAVLAQAFGLRAAVVVHRRVDNPIRRGFFNDRKYAAPRHFIAIGEAVRAALMSAAVPAEKISVVSSGVPPHEPVAGAKAALAAACGIDAGVPWVGDVAGLVDHKGHAHLLDAWPRVRADIDAALILIGDGPRRSALEQHARVLNISDSVHFVGWRDDVPAWLSALDVFAMTSVTEGLCSAILDAMAARVPVVATAAGGIPELVIDDQTGRLAAVADPADIAAKLRLALTDRDRAAALAAAAYETVWRDRSADRMVERTAAIYRGLLSV